MGRATAAGMMALAGALAAPALATAAVHSARVVLPPPHRTPAPGSPSTPVAQQREYLHEAVLLYDARAGSVSFTEELWEPAFWGERIATTFTIGSRCSEGGSTFPQAFRAQVMAKPATKTAAALGVTGQATFKGHGGPVPAKGTFDGRRFRITFTSRAFRNQNWRCAAVPVSEFITFEHRTFSLSGWPKSKGHKH